MTTREIKPSDLQSWEKIEADSVRHSPQVKMIEDKTAYAYYFDGLWMPHRKPTVREITHDKFN